MPAAVGSGTLTSLRGGPATTFAPSRGTRSRIGGVAAGDEDRDQRARAVVFEAPRRARVVAVDLGSPGDGDVLVRTLWSGISAGTEMLAYRGEIDPDLPLDETIGALGGSFAFPFRYGYCCVGRVERSRSEVPEGQLVFAFHPHQDAFVIAAADVIGLGDIDPRLATLFPLVETALQVALDAGPVLEEHVAVTGLGVVGILTAVMLQRAGARVLGVEPLRTRRAAAAAVGLDAASPEEAAELIPERAPAGLPLLVEASGRPEVLRDSLPYLAQEGEALVVSWYGTKDVHLPLGAEFHRRRLRIRSTQVSSIPAALAGRWSRDRRRTVVRDLLGELPLAPLATHAFPFEQAAEALAAVDRGDAGLVHAALCYT
jgi:2-desacetyl-2-hydroxyethyl bacteriochlorophyllide A dehydrogenase